MKLVFVGLAIFGAITCVAAPAVIPSQPAKAVAVPVEAVPIEPVQRWEYLRSQASALYAQSRYSEALASAEAALQIALAHFAKNDARVGVSYNNIAANQYALARYQSAFDNYERTIAVYEVAVGKDSPRLATVLSNQAEAARFLDLPDVAEARVRRAIAILINSHDRTDQFRLMAAYSNLASLRGDIFDIPDAMTNQLASLSLARKLYGEDAAETASANVKLADIMFRNDDVSGAKALLLASIPVMERQLGREHSDVAYAKEGLADALSALKEYDAALIVINEALNTHIARFGKESANLSDAYLRRAEIFAGTARYADAEKDLLLAEKLWVEEMGEGYHRIMDARLGLAAVYIKQDRLAEAEPLLLAVLASREARKAVEWMILDPLAGLYEIYDRTGRLTERDLIRQRAERLGAEVGEAPKETPTT